MEQGGTSKLRAGTKSVARPTRKSNKSAPAGPKHDREGLVYVDPPPGLDEIPAEQRTDSASQPSKDDLRSFRDAARNAVIKAIDSYLPIGLGVLFVGLPVCAVAALAHFVVGVPLSLTGIAGGTTGLGTFLTKWIENKKTG